MSHLDFHLADRVRRRARLHALLAAPPRPFNMSGWVFALAEAGPTKDAAARVTCDTAACALGMAALDPELQEEGLTVSVWGGNANALIPSYGELTEWCAGAAFFGISDMAAEALFQGPYRIRIAGVNHDRLLSNVGPDAVTRRLNHIERANGIWHRTDHLAA